MIDNKNLILAVVLSLAILLGFEFFFASQRADLPPDRQTAEQAGQPPAQQGGATRPAVPRAEPNDASVPQVPGADDVSGAVTPVASGSRSDLISKQARVRIDTPRLAGSIALEGGRIDDLTLADYFETLKRETAITLLNPRGASNPYFAQFGWVPADASVKTPGDATLWTANRQTLTIDAPVTLTWDNGEGLIFKRTLTLDENFMFHVNQTVENKSGNAVALYPYGLISRHGTPETSGFFVLHEGLLGVAGGALQEIDYDDLREQKTVNAASTGGWLGITDKYWLTALVPNQQSKVQQKYRYVQRGRVDTYQVDYLGELVTVPAGGARSVESDFFAGAKEVRVLDAYEETRGIDRFDLTIDWGWFYFLTRPIFYGLLWIYEAVGNYGAAIILLTIAIKLAFFPLANKSYKSLSKLKKLQPEMVKLRERYGDDKMKLQEEMMKLYKREGANPASGCLPILVQIPVFFALYKVLFVTIEVRHAPFFGWIQDLSAPDPTTMFNLFGLIPWTPPAWIPLIGVWPLLMGVSMWLQQKLNPQPPDPVQAKVMLLLPVLFTFLLATFPAGLVIYWTFNNALSILQQWVIMRKMGVPAS